MRLIGLTGSIGMGKSTAAAMLARMGVAVHDSDAAVHRLQARGGAAVPAIEAAFPGSVRDGAVDRQALGQQVLGDPAALRRLEAILHPAVRADIEAFLRRCRLEGRGVAVLDVPLLLEGNLHKRVDEVWVISAPAFLQAQRVLARPGMTRAKLDQVRRRQMPDAEKRARADVVIPSGLGRAVTWRALASALATGPAGRSTARGLARRRLAPYVSAHA